MQVPEVEKRVAVKAGNGYLLHFPVKQTLPVGIRLVDSQQKPLPVGSVAKLASGKISPVGLGGFAWFDDAGSENHQRPVHERNILHGRALRRQQYIQQPATHGQRQQLHQL